MTSNDAKTIHVGRIGWLTTEQAFEFQLDSEGTFVRHSKAVQDLNRAAGVGQLIAYLWPPRYSSLVAMYVDDGILKALVCEQVVEMKPGSIRVFSFFLFPLTFVWFASGHRRRFAIALPSAQRDAVGLYDDLLDSIGNDARDPVRIASAKLAYGAKKEVPRYASELEQALTALEGQTCWSVLASNTTGLAIHLKFGKQRPRQKVLKNREISEADRKFDGEFVLYVATTWRIHSPEGATLDCEDEQGYRPGGPTLTALAKLKDQTVKGARFERATRNLKLELANGHTLEIYFPTQPDGELHYLFLDPTAEFDVMSGGLIGIGARR